MWFHSLCGVHNGDCGMWVKWCATGLRYVGQVMFDVKGLLDAFDLHSGRRTAEMRWTDGRICKQPKQWCLLLWRFPKIRVPQIIQVIRPFLYWNPWFWSPILGPMITPSAPEYDGDITLLFWLIRSTVASEMAYWRWKDFYSPGSVLWVNLGASFQFHGQCFAGWRLWTLPGDYRYYRQFVIKPFQKVMVSCWNKRKVKRTHIWICDSLAATALVRLRWTAEYSIKVEQIFLPRRVFCSTRPFRWMNLGAKMWSRTAGAFLMQKWVQKGRSDAEVLCWRFNHGHIVLPSPGRRTKWEYWFLAWVEPKD